MNEEKRLVSTWESLIKNNEGEAEIHTLHKYEVAPEIDEQHFITQAAPTIIRPTKRRTPTHRDSLSLAAGDAQIGFRGEEPFHNERAMGLFLTAVREMMPNYVTLTGDMVDLPAMSRYEQRSDWQHTTQAALDRYHTFLAEIRANAPNARIIAVHGNHELRQQTMLRRDAAALIGIRRANAEKELSVLTLQYLLRYNELEVEGVDGYPNAAFWLEDNLKITHGTQTKKGGASAAAYLRSETESTVFGHDHRLQLAYRTLPHRLGHTTLVAASPGCLARIDGSVPGTKYSTDEHNETVHRAEDWQNGLLVIRHNERHHQITPVQMTDEGMWLEGKFYE